MRSYRFIFVLLIIGLCMAICSPAWATKVINLTTGETLFSHDYEGEYMVDSSTFYPDTNYDGVVNSSDRAGGCSLDFDPDSPQVGGYGSIPSKELVFGTQVIDYAEAASGEYVGDPGAFEGEGYLRVVRAKSYYVLPLTFDNSGSGVSNGDTIHLESMVATAGLLDISTSAKLPFVTFYEGDTPLTVCMAQGGDGGTSADIICRVLGQSDTDTGLDFTADLTWFKWEIDYVVGASTYSLTFDGQTASDLPIYNSATPGTASGLNVRIPSASHSVKLHCYLDSTAVPEPSMIALGLAGLFGLGVCRFRRR